MMIHVHGLEQSEWARGREYVPLLKNTILFPLHKPKKLKYTNTEDYKGKMTSSELKENGTRLKRENWFL